MEIFNIIFDKVFDNRHLCTDDYQNNSRLLLFLLGQQIESLKLYEVKRVELLTGYFSI